MWCHLLLSMPVLGLGLFLVLPVSLALPLYLLVVVVSLFLYSKIMQSMRIPVVTGPEALVGQVLTTNWEGLAFWQGEWWTTEPRLANQLVRIVGLRGPRLLVEPVDE